MILGFEMETPGCSSSPCWGPHRYHDDPRVARSSPAGTRLGKFLAAPARKCIAGEKAAPAPKPYSRDSSWALRTRSSVKASALAREPRSTADVLQRRPGGRGHGQRDDGRGLIIGPRIASITVAGGILSVAHPRHRFQGGLTTPLFPATKLISAMEPFDIWKSYVLYIGAGAVAAGGVVSMIRSLPTIVHGAKAGLAGLKNAGKGAARALSRTDTDLPFTVVVGGIAALIAVIWALPTLHMNLLGALLIIVFGFLFVLVSSRLTGEIGSSSNPISGMTVATLLFTSLIFLALGWTSPTDRVTALTIAAIVCIAAPNGGTTSQDLKTVYIVGVTPKAQQIAILIGALTSALVIGYTLDLLNKA